MTPSPVAFCGNRDTATPVPFARVVWTARVLGLCFCTARVNEAANSRCWPLLGNGSRAYAYALGVRAASRRNVRRSFVGEAVLEGGAAAHTWATAPSRA